MIQAYGNGIYRAEAQKVGDKNHAQELTLQLQEVQKKLEHPLISAKHIGLNLQIFVVDLNFDTENPQNYRQTFINPELISSKAPLVSMLEDDVSIPKMVVSIERPKHIEIRFQNEELMWQTVVLSDQLAHWALHGIDQLKGISIIDRLNGHRQRSVRSHLRRLSERKIETDYCLEWEE